MTTVIIDLECQNYEYLQEVASPHNPDNWIVAVGYKVDDNPVVGKYFKTKEEYDEKFINGILDSLGKSDCLVAHNATFEIHWLLSRHYKSFVAALKRGMIVLCTQYAEYLLSNQQEMYPDLNTTAPKYGGTEKIDEVHILWEEGKLTTDIDKDMLMEYLCSDHGDVENTYKVFKGQKKALEERGAWEMYKLRCDSLLYCAFCTFNGIKINRETAFKNLKEQLAKAEELRSKITKYLPSDLPSELSFEFTSDYHMSAWLYGGTIAYDAKVPYDPPKYEKKIVLDYEHPYTRGAQKGQPRKVQVDDLERPKTKWGKKYYSFKGLVDLKTLPKELAEDFLSERGTFRGKRFLVDGSPVYSSSSDALRAVSPYCPVCVDLCDLADLDKDNGTYYLVEEKDKDGNVTKRSGMLQYLTDKDIIHHHLISCGTVTGRLSSNKPNLQNLPREGTSKVKEMMVSRYGEDGRVMECDYTSLEVVANAAITHCTKLLDLLEQGTDMHCYRLAFDLREPYEDVYRKCHDENDPEHKQYKNLRTAIKRKSFAAQYGASAKGIAFATGCPVADAERFLENESKMFPEIIAFRQTVRDAVETTSCLPEALHRETDDTGKFRVYRTGYFQSPGGTRYQFRQKEKWENGQIIMDFKDTEIANYPTQGESAFIVQVANALTIRTLLKYDFYDGTVTPFNNVHDALYFDCKDDKTMKMWAAMIVKIMSYAPIWICNKIPAYREWDYDKVAFKAVPDGGPNLYSTEEIK